MHVCPECFRLYGPDQGECEHDAAKLVPYLQFLIGMRLGPYVVRSMLSEGGMGVVYVAEHPALGRRVAIKVLRPELSLRDDIVERFTQEARAVNTIGHENIVNIYDFGKTPFGSFYIVMEYLDGMTVRALLDEAGPQPLEQIRFVLSGVAAALGAAHAKGFVHRDVKPANIMVYQRGGKDYIKLLDFGIAKLLTAAESTTDSGLALGTPQYMSPEQLESGAADPRADIYSLGVVAYELFTGQVPFPGASQAAVRHAQASYRPQPPSRSRRDIRLAESIDDFVFKAIATSPADRFATIDEFMAGFQAAHADTLEQQSSRPPPSGAGTPRRRPWPVALAGVLAGALILGGVWLLSTRDVTQPSSALHDQAPKEAALARPSALPAKPDADRIVSSALTGPEREQRIEAIETIRAVRAKTLAPLLRESLQDADSAVRREAGLALAELGAADEATIQALRAALPSQLSFTAIAMARALARLGDPRGVARLRRELALAPRRGPRAVRFALEALAEFDPSAARRLAPFARTMQWEDTPEGKARLLLLMAQAGDPAARRELQTALEQAPNEQALLHAGLACDVLDPDLARPVLQRLAQSASGPVRARANGALAAHGDVKASESLLDLLSSAESATRTAAALSFARTYADGALPAPLSARGRDLLVRSLSDSRAKVQLAAAIALLAFGSKN